MPSHFENMVHLSISAFNHPGDLDRGTSDLECGAQDSAQRLIT